MPGAKERRRGAALEDAILDAAWAELNEHGYRGMTLEAVARRAATSRPVLHRRWPSRLKLTTAALRRYMDLNPIEVADLGSVGAELFLFLRGLADRAKPELIRLLLEASTDLGDGQTSIADVRATFANDRLVRSILDRAVNRGEIDPNRLTPRMVALPVDLTRHELLMTFEPPSDAVIREIVNDIFLPLVAPRHDRS